MAQPRNYEDHNRLAAKYIELFQSGSLVSDIALALGFNSVRTLRDWRVTAEAALGTKLPRTHLRNISGVDFDHLKFEKKKLSAIIGSDWHILPEETSFAEQVFMRTLEKHKFDFVVLNGDVSDQPSVSRHGRMRGEPQVDIQEEIEAVQERLRTIERLQPKAKKIFVIGNHDNRLDKYIMRNAPALENVKGTQLEHLFPKWNFCMSAQLNDVWIKHFWNTSLHGAYNNTLRSGATYITGHCHRLQITPWTDLNGTRYGVECGTLANPAGVQFLYTENSPKNWQPGFVVMELEQFKDGFVDKHFQLVDCTLRKPRVYGERWDA